MFANTKKILNKAQKEGYAIGHFNINNMEILQAIVNAANQTNSPIIIAVSEGAIEYAGFDYLITLVQTATKQTTIPIAFHLDHGKNLPLIKKCINSGFSSIMFDGSHLPFEENIKITKQIVKLAHKKGVSVEAEIGTIGGAEDKVSSRQIIYTNPSQAKEFVKKTKCDFLAIAIGTSHGPNKFEGPAHLRLDILKEIQKQIKIPLVLHGASGVPQNIVTLATKYGATLPNVIGVPNNQIKKAIKLGICKINTDTDLRLAFDAGIRKSIKEHPNDIDPRHMLTPAKDLITLVVKERITTFGSKNKINKKNSTTANYQHNQ